VQRPGLERADMAKAKIPKIATEKAQEALIVYFYTGSFRKAAKAVGCHHNVIAELYRAATPEQLERARKKSNEILESNVLKILSLSTERLVKSLESKELIPANTLNVIAGTFMDKIMILRKLTAKDIPVPRDINITVALGTGNLTQAKPGTPVNRMTGLIDGQGS